MFENTEFLRLVGAYGVHYWHCSHSPPSVADMDAMTSCDNQQFCCCGILAHLFWRDGPCPAILSGEMTISAVDQWRGPVPLPAWGCAWDRCNISWDGMHPHSDQRGSKPSTYSWPALIPHRHRREAKEARRKKKSGEEFKTAWTLNVVLSPCRDPSAENRNHTGSRVWSTGSV